MIIHLYNAYMAETLRSHAEAMDSRACWCTWRGLMRMRVVWQRR